MMETKYNLFDATEGKVAKQTDMKKCAMYIAIILISAALTAASAALEDKASVLYMLLVTVGIIGVATGLLMLAFGRRRYLFLPTKSKIRRYSFHLDAMELIPLIGALDTKQFEMIKSMKRSQESGIRVDVIESDDNEFAGIRIYEYIPYSYVPATQFYCTYGDDAKSLSKAIK